MIETFLNFIQQVGFPIAACVALFWKMNEQDEAHSKEVKEMTTAINNNTVVIQKLIDNIEKE